MLTIFLHLQCDIKHQYCLIFVLVEGHTSIKNRSSYSNSEVLTLYPAVSPIQKKITPMISVLSMQ